MAPKPKVMPARRMCRTRPSAWRAIPARTTTCMRQTLRTWSTHCTKSERHLVPQPRLGHMAIPLASVLASESCEEGHPSCTEVWLCLLSMQVSLLMVGAGGQKRTRASLNRPYKPCAAGHFGVHGARVCPWWSAACGCAPLGDRQP